MNKVFLYVSVVLCFLTGCRKGYINYDEVTRLNIKNANVEHQETYAFDYDFTDRTLLDSTKQLVRQIQYNKDGNIIEDYNLHTPKKTLASEIKNNYSSDGKLTETIRYNIEGEDKFLNMTDKYENGIIKESIVYNKEGENVGQIKYTCDKNGVKTGFVAYENGQVAINYSAKIIDGVVTDEIYTNAVGVVTSRKILTLKENVEVLDTYFGERHALSHDLYYNNDRQLLDSVWEYKILDGKRILAGKQKYKYNNLGLLEEMTSFNPINRPLRVERTTYRTFK